MVCNSNLTLLRIHDTLVFTGRGAAISIVFDII